MALKLGNFSIDEILYGVAETRDDGVNKGEILYTLDQLSSASIEISAESTDFTDKKGNVWRTVYTSKTGTFNATNAMLHPQILAAASGAMPEYGSAASPILKMPKIIAADAGQTVELPHIVNDSVTNAIGAMKVIGVYGNGANAQKQLSDETLGGDNAIVKRVTTGGTTKITIDLPAHTTDEDPVSYVIVYDYSDEGGIKIVNDAYSFPEVVKLTLYVSYVDPCDQKLKGAYVVFPMFQADPNQTISLDRETQEIDFNGKLNIDFCNGTVKPLYYIYFPSDAYITTGVAGE